MDSMQSRKKMQRSRKTVVRTVPDLDIDARISGQIHKIKITNLEHFVKVALRNGIDLMTKPITEKIGKRTKQCERKEQEKDKGQRA